MENVSQILSFKQKPVLDDFISTLKQNGYYVTFKTVFCPDYGIPQTRKRLVLLASRYGTIELIPPTHSPENYKTVRAVIGSLPPIKAGEICKSDTLHRARSLTELNLKRIKATPLMVVGEIGLNNYNYSVIKKHLENLLEVFMDE